MIWLAKNKLLELRLVNGGVRALRAVTEGTKFRIVFPNAKFAFTFAVLVS